MAGLPTMQENLPVHPAAGFRAAVIGDGEDGGKF
jgi:hypothetical protein